VTRSGQRQNYRVPTENSDAPALAIDKDEAGLVRAEQGSE
jgi:hypothetical protein